MKALANVVGEVKGSRVLLARAEEARDVLPKMLEQKGALVTVAPVYRTVKLRRAPADVKRRLLEGDIDVVTFTSSSTVKNFAESIGSDRIPEIRPKVLVASIGPITSETADITKTRP